MEHTMTELTPELALVGRELSNALGLRIIRLQRARRRVRVLAASVAALGASAATAMASGIADDLRLDPTKWTIFDSGSVADGQAAYVKAHATDGSGDSTFLVEHDAGLARYEAFVLHEQVVAASGGDGENGTLCSAGELTRAEKTALATLGSSFAPGTDADATTNAVNAALKAEFAGATCRGLDYAGERARFVYAGLEPRAMVMPGAR